MEGRPQGAPLPVIEWDQWEEGSVKVISLPECAERLMIRAWIAIPDWGERGRCLDLTSAPP